MKMTAWLNGYPDGELVETVNPEPYGDLRVALQVMVNKLEARKELKHCSVIIRGPKDIFDFCKGVSSELCVIDFKE